MLINLLKFEWRFHSRQLTFYLGLFVFLFFGFFVTGRLGFAGKLYINSPYLINSVYLFLSLMSPIMIAIFTAQSVLRDQVNQSSEMVYASHLKAWQFVSSRYLGLVVISFLILSAASLTMMLKTYLPIGIDGNFTENSLASYAWVLFVFILPNIILCTAISFAVACITRSIIATYLSGLLIYVLYLLTSMYVGSPLFGENLPADPFMRQIAALVDPFGLSAFEVETEFWSVAQKNSQLVPFDNSLLLNRIIWFFVSLIIMSVVLLRFKLNLNSRSSNKKKRKDSVNNYDSLPVHLNTSNYQPVSTNLHLGAQMQALFSCVRLEINYLIKSYVFWAIVALWSVFLFGEIYSITLSHDFTSSYYPMTSIVIERFLYDLLPRFTLFVIVFYTADMVWREKELKMNAFTDASPTKSAIFFFSKYLALCLIPFFLISVAIIIGVLVQISDGYYQFELGLYFSLFYYGGLPLVLNIALCLFVHAISSNKYMGMLISVFLLLFLGTNLSQVIGLEHGLWRFASAPSFEYSDMNGYAHISTAFAIYMLHWSSLALTLSLISFGLWQRGGDVPFINRFKQITLQLGRKGIITIIIFSTIFLTTGSYIYFKSNIEANYYSNKESELWHVNYEKKYKKYENIAQPKITSIKTHVDLYPNDNRFYVEGEYGLINNNNQAIQDIIITLDNDLDLIELNLYETNGDKAQLQQSDKQMGTYVFKLRNGMQINDKIKLDFKLQQQQSEFGQYGSSSLITDNASMLYSSNQFPSVGYIIQRQLSNNYLRKQYGLAINSDIQNIHDALDDKGDKVFRDNDFIDFETIISTSSDQTAISSGSLINQWVANDRAFFHYKADAPIRNVLFYLSSRYAQATEYYQGIKLQVFYTSKHGVNVKRMLQAIKDSLSYQIENFGPYPHTQFKQVETAEYTGFTGFAAPTMTLISENSGFTYDLNQTENLDQVYRRGAHEVAHQWWGYQIAPANIDEGSMLLVETLARYSESMVMKQIFGNEMALRYINFEMDRYFRGRARESVNEMPLYRSRQGQSYLVYSKGAVAMYALQNTIGELKLNAALQELLKNHKYPMNPATSLDLLNYLYAAAPDHISYINEWFKQITYFENTITNISYQPLSNGRYQVELELNTNKVRVDLNGEESQIDFKQVLEVEITQKNQSSPTVYEIDIVPGKNTYTIETDKVPLSMRLDPRSLLLNKYRHQAIKDF